MLTKSPLSARRVSARDRRRAAIHEGGHVVVARHLGILGIGAEIRKFQSRDFTRRQWGGSFTFVEQEVVLVASEPATVKVRRAPKYKMRRAPKYKLMLVAVAGAVAEACWCRETFDDTYDTWYEPSVMSETDWDHAGCAPGEPSKQLWDSVEEAFQLLNRSDGKLWNDLVRESRHLIECCR